MQSQMDSNIAVIELLVDADMELERQQLLERIPEEQDEQHW